MTAAWSSASALSAATDASRCTCQRARHELSSEFARRAGAGAHEHKPQLLCDRQRVGALHAREATRSASVVPPRYLLSEVIAAPRKVAAVPLQQADLLRDVPAHGSVYVYDLGHAIRKEDGIEVLRV
jgi:hypothetical protein